MNEVNPSLAFLKKHREIFILLALLVVVLLVMANLSRHFWTLRNLIEAPRLGSEIGLISIGMAIVILLGGIDLSVGAMFAMSAIIMGITIEATGSVFLAVCAAIAVGIVLGFINGITVSMFSIPPIIATLGTMSLFRGVAMGISRGKSYPLPEELYDIIGGRSIAGIPLQFIIFVVAAAIVIFVLTRTSLGRSMIATGNNPVAAMFTGVNVKLIKIIAYASSGLFCSVAAVLFSCRVTSAKADFGIGYEMDAITIVVLGGATLKGGKASIFGAVLGMLILIMARRGLTMALVQPEVQTIIFGLLLIIAVGINSLSSGSERAR